MLTLLVIFGMSCLACLALTPLARALASRYGLLDHPDARRKIHGRPVPLAGGLAVLTSALAALAAAAGLSGTVNDLFAHDATLLLGLLVAALGFCALGVLDDYRCLRGRHKLLGQVAILGVLLQFGVAIEEVHLFGTDVALGHFWLPVTLLWLLGAVNSLNLLDGMDGLLSSVGFLVLAALAAMAVLGGHWSAACVAVAVAGALLGFLRYNFPPASVFLGDAGSMLIGLVIGVLAIRSSLKAPATVALVAPVALLTLPFFDTLAAIVRRKLTGRSIYATDRGHLHHCLLRRGLSARHALLLISLLCLLTVLGALASLALRNELVAILATVTVVGILVATRLFGHAEFELVGKRILQLLNSFLRLPGAGKSRRLEVHLQGTTAWFGLTEAVAVEAFNLNLQSFRLEISAPALHEEYHSEWNRFDEEPDETTVWRAELPLTIGERHVGRLLVVGYKDADPLAEKISALSRLMEEFEAGLNAAAKDADDHKVTSLVTSPSYASLADETP
jgi:UDP-GlcNAc:undecaprenyl-phosphate GlcNAc-1-phosphate transferase